MNRSTASSKSGNPLLRLAIAGYNLLITIGGWLQHVFLLVIRLYWGWQFFTTGMGKLAHIDKITGYFHTLGIPFPEVNAYLAGSTECFGGLLLLTDPREFSFSELKAMPKQEQITKHFCIQGWSGVAKWGGVHQ